MTRLGILVIIAALLCGCGNNSGHIRPGDVVNVPNTADGVAKTGSLPAFQFDEEVYDFGRLGQGEVVTHVFKFTNAGKSDLLISSAKSSCGCTVADFPKSPIKPGGAGQIAIKYDTEGRKGIQTKTVTLVANTQPNTKVLTVKAEIVVPEK